MSDLIVFALGFVLFAATSSATMWFGYQQFNRIYRSDMARDPEAPVLMSDENDFEYRVPADQVERRNLDLVTDERFGEARHLTA